MVSEQTRNDVWQELLDVARLVRYYEALSNRYRHNHMIVRFLLLVVTLGGIAALLDLLPPVAQIIAGAVVALLFAWDHAADYAKKAAVLQAISLECSLLEDEWKQLWATICAKDANVTDEEARRMNRQLTRRISYVTGWAGQADVRDDPRLNKECEKVAHKVMADRYVA